MILSAELETSSQMRELVERVELIELKMGMANECSQAARQQASD